MNSSAKQFPPCRAVLAHGCSFLTGTLLDGALLNDVQVATATHLRAEYAVNTPT
jgi:hypothetical protein